MKCMITQSEVSNTRVKWLGDYVKYHNVFFYDSIFVLKSELCLGDYHLRDEWWYIPPQWIKCVVATLKVPMERVDWFQDIMC